MVQLIALWPYQSSFGLRPTVHCSCQPIQPQLTEVNSLSKHASVFSSAAVVLVAFTASTALTRSTSKTSTTAWPVADIAGRTHLRSAERYDMLVPPTMTQLCRCRGASASQFLLSDTRFRCICIQPSSAVDSSEMAAASLDFLSYT